MILPSYGLEIFWVTFFPLSFLIFLHCSFLSSYLWGYPYLQFQPQSATSSSKSVFKFHWLMFECSSTSKNPGFMSWGNTLLQCSPGTTCRKSVGQCTRFSFHPVSLWLLCTFKMEKRVSLPHRLWHMEEGHIKITFIFSKRGNKLLKDKDQNQFFPVIKC